MKRWWESKTFWLNFIAVMIAIVQAIQQDMWINPEYQVMILAILNGILRLLTSTAIAGTPGSKSRRISGH